MLWILRLLPCGYAQDDYENVYRTLERHNLLEPICWMNDSWPIVDAAHDLGEIDPESLGYVPLSSDFNASELGWQWQFYKAFEPQRFSVGEDAKSSSPQCLFPQHRVYQTEVEVETEGDANAGLTFVLWRTLSAWHRINARIAGGAAPESRTVSREI